MKRKIILSLTLLSLFQIACVKLEEDKSKSKESQLVQGPIEELSPTKLNTDSLIALIDEYRASIEVSLPEATELSTDSLRAKIKQKWDRIHFYAENGKLQRIKTYPYPEISERTEEFYIKEGELIMVVIEDKDGEERGKEKSEIDKLYYFHNGEVIHELKKDEKAEYSIRQSDGEELYTEFKEYEELFEAMKN